jgi:hypothetical protein
MFLSRGGVGDAAIHAGQQAITCLASAKRRGRGSKGRKYCGDRNLSNVMVITAVCNGGERLGKLWTDAGVDAWRTKPGSRIPSPWGWKTSSRHSSLYVHPFAQDSISRSTWTQISCGRYNILSSRRLMSDPLSRCRRGTATPRPIDTLSRVGRSRYSIFFSTKRRIS